MWFAPQPVPPSLQEPRLVRSSHPPTTARPPGVRGTIHAGRFTRVQGRGARRRRQARGWTTRNGPEGGPPGMDRVPMTADRVTSPGGGGGPPSNPLYLNHLWSYRETESATAFLAPRRPINHKTPDPGVFRCHFRGWDRRVLASPYKKCYVCGVLGDAGRCGVWVRTRKFGGYMKGKDERKVVKHDCSSGRVFQSKCLEPASPWFGLVKAGLARRSASAQPSTAGWP